MAPFSSLAAPWHVFRFASYPVPASYLRSATLLLAHVPGWRGRAPLGLATLGLDAMGTGADGVSPRALNAPQR